jgi:hypothetical protein
MGMLDVRVGGAGGPAFLPNRAAGSVSSAESGWGGNIDDAGRAGGSSGNIGTAELNETERFNDRDVRGRRNGRCVVGEVVSRVTETGAGSADAVDVDAASNTNDADVAFAGEGETDTPFRNAPINCQPVQYNKFNNALSKG